MLCFCEGVGDPVGPMLIHVCQNAKTCVYEYTKAFLVSFENTVDRFFVKKYSKICIGTGRGGTTLTNAVLGQSQSCAGTDLEISPGIGTLGNFSGKHAIIPGHCRKNRYIGGNFFSSIPKIREDDPNFRDDFS